MKKMSGVTLCAILVAAFVLVAGPRAFSGQDKHFIQDDDYFISREPLKEKAWMYVTIAKMIKAPKPETKNEGEFMQITDGKKVWTKYYWKTVMATEADLKLGDVVIMAEVSGEDDVYQPPKDKEEARSTNWFVAKITDVTDIYKGYVSVSGGYKASVKNIRIAVKK